VRKFGSTGNKFNAKIVKTDEGTFRSKGEYNYWCALVLRQRAGDIRNLRHEPRYPITINGVKICDVLPDFEYEEWTGNDWILVVEDHKSPATITPVYKLKKKLLFAIYGIEVREVYSQ